MLDSSNEKKLSILGEVVETFNDKDKQILKIIIKSGNLDLTVNESENLRLGDTLLIEAAIKIKNIKSCETASTSPIKLNQQVNPQIQKPKQN